MALKDKLAAPPASRRLNVVETWRDGLDDATRVAFDAAVLDHAWTTTALHAVLLEDGFELGRETLARYRARKMRERA
ncbi:hypothetical protein SK224_05460 [Microbacterium sp. BG28]|jgi:hypothetical protein|uniref:hypothetical protein n=1 Tax=Microbacterium sp. BG28 TaxID=3097356 RepID=UPI002A5AA0BF|nr:hypothetical protein [Microbacterium sp. BG28]MDY0828572.1 hypothetical protein [Microbacterium sp. BG28]